MTFSFHIITNVGMLLKSELVRGFARTLCLAQLYKEPGYAEALKEKIANGDRVILDNGAHEGIDYPIAEYLAIALDLQPTVVVLTDLVGRTSEQSRANSFRLLWALTGQNETECPEPDWAVVRDAFPKTKFMYVPQGANKQQVMDDYRWAINNLDPDLFIIGFGQGYLCWASNEWEVNQEATRLPMVMAALDEHAKWLQKQADDNAQALLEGKPQKEIKTFEFHVLGARWSADSIHYGHISPYISGIDTIKPTTCAFTNRVFPNRPDIRSIVRESSDVVSEALLIQNINAFCVEYGCVSGLAH